MILGLMLLMTGAGLGHACEHGGQAVLLVEVGRAVVEVRGMRVRLDDVAEVDVLADGERGRAVRARAAWVELGRFAPGRTKMVIGEERILRALVRAGFDREAVDIGGVPSVEVRQKLVTLTPPRLRRLARRHVLDAVGPEAGPVEVREAGRLPSFSVPAPRWRSNVRVEADPKNPHYVGRVELRFSVEVDGELMPPVTLPFHVGRRVDVVKVKRRVTRGRPLTLNDVELAPIEPARLQSDMIFDLNDAVGLVVRAGVTRGQVLRRRDVRALPVVREGDLVMARLRLGVLKAEALCRAREDGAPGDRIVLENVESQKAVYAVVVDARTVDVVASRGADIR